jgi:GTPase SAR1 family protein
MTPPLITPPPPPRPPPPRPPPPLRMLDEDLQRVLLEGDPQLTKAVEAGPSTDEAVTSLLSRPLWMAGMPANFDRSWRVFQEDARSLESGFEVWLEWYQERLDGKPFNSEIERLWAILSKERLAQDPREINAYLRSLRTGASSEEFRRVRSIFIGHGGTGKSSLIVALHGEKVVEGQSEMTRGIDIQEAAAVLRRFKNSPGKGLAVHFWDFGGQVMAHATHQFFLRAKCLYVIVLDGRPERNANEEAEYWLAHVRAFGDSAPVLLVGNKVDQARVDIDLRTLKQKHPNILGFYPLSCTQAHGARRAEFELFERDFESALLALTQNSERFTRAQLNVLEQIRKAAESDDFLDHDRFGAICAGAGIPEEGPASRTSLLDLFDKLGIVMHFPHLPYLSEYVLNPQWLTYGVYTIMYSDRAKDRKGRIRAQDVVQVFKESLFKDAQNRGVRYPPERCRTIVDAMVAFRIAYRFAYDPDGLVIPALLEPNQPQHNFDPAGALMFRFDFQGFLPRHVLPTLIVDRHQEIDRIGDAEIVWQNGVLLKARRGLDARALVKADYHERHVDLQVTGLDAARYLGILRDSILKTLETMPELPFEEKVQLRPSMRADREQSLRLGDPPIWIPYVFIETALSHSVAQITGSDRRMYDVSKIVNVVPLPRDLRTAEVFLSYSKADRDAVQKVAEVIEAGGFTVWFDRDLMVGDSFRKVIADRIDSVRAVVVLWTANSKDSKWVIDEANRGHDLSKLICLRADNIENRDIPAPFSSNDHIVRMGDTESLLEALAKSCRR